MNLAAIAEKNQIFQKYQQTKQSKVSKRSVSLKDENDGFVYTLNNSLFDGPTTLAGETQF